MNNPSLVIAFIYSSSFGVTVSFVAAFVWARPFEANTIHTAIDVMER